LISEIQLRPTFLGIGSQRCGTSWAARVLRSHPDIFLSRPKELNFFSKEMMWKDLRWYFDQFETERPVRGEICPQYARLKLNQVKRIAQLLPDLRVFLIIREPVSRTWSQACYELGFNNKRRLNQIKQAEFLRHIQRTRSLLYTDYLRTIRNWRTAFGDDALYVETLDALSAQPHQSYRELFRYLGADPRWLVPDDLIARQTNTTEQRTQQAKEHIPAFVRWYLSISWLEPTKRLNEELDGLVSDWVVRMEDALHDAPASWTVKRAVNQWLLSAPERVAYSFFDHVRDLRMHQRYDKFDTQIAGL
jgi:hypothetical protein